MIHMFAVRVGHLPLPASRMRWSCRYTGETTVHRDHCAMQIARGRCWFDHYANPRSIGAACIVGPMRAWRCCISRLSCERVGRTHRESGINFRCYFDAAGVLHTVLAVWSHILRCTSPVFARALIGRPKTPSSWRTYVPAIPFLASCPLAYKNNGSEAAVEMWAE